MNQFAFVCVMLLLFFDDCYTLNKLKILLAKHNALLRIMTVSLVDSRNRGNMKAIDGSGKFKYSIIRTNS